MQGQMQDVLAGQARWAVACADARAALAALPDNSVDSVCTDPPYALTDKRGGSKGFMSSAWDNGSVAHDPAFWAEVRRVAKPGAFLLAFGGTRTYHRLACAVEDAGWECRDMIMWHYGSGFPKSKSCLKPSHEPIVLAKAPGPLQPLQIDSCRVPAAMAGEDPRGQGRPKGAEGCFPFSDDAWGNGRLRHSESHPAGRWPPNTLLSHVGGPDGCQPAGVRRVRGTNTPGPNGRSGQRQIGWTLPAGRINHYAEADGSEQVQSWTCVDGCPVAELDRQAGPRTSGGRTHYPGEVSQSNWRVHEGRSDTHRHGSAYERASSSGPVHRFFPTFAPDPEDAVPFRYEPKASRRDRGEGNTHSTVKPTALMAWLCKLVTKEDGVVLDCFGGSGSTAVAALRCGMRAIIIEQDAHYCDIARARIAHALEQQAGPLFAGIAAQR